MAVVAHGLSSAGGLSVAKNIVNSLITVAPGNEYLFILPDDVGYEEELGISKKHRAVYVSRDRGTFRRILYDLFTLPPLIKRWKADVVFCLGNFGLHDPGCFQAILYHKPHFVYPEVRFSQPFSARLKNWLIRRQIERSLPKTHVVFCQTPAIQARFKNAFSYGGVIDILPNAVSKFATGDEDDATGLPAALKARLGSSRVKLLALTRYYPHKNLDIFLDLFQRYREELRDFSVVLTIEGSQHAGAKRLLKKIESNNLEDKIINIGPVEQTLLPALYRAVDALLLPTLLESFSGTYIEAMQFRRPILTSDRDFARAVCDDAALYFDPLSVEDIKAKLLTFAEDEALRGKLRERGRERINQLSVGWGEIVKRALATMTSMRGASSDRDNRKASG